MEFLEGKICVMAALKARQRKINVIYLRQGIHVTNISELLSEAQRQNISIRYCAAGELDAIAQGVTHGGVIARCSPKPPIRPPEFFNNHQLIHRSNCLLLLEGIDDPQNLGFTLRTAEALGVAAVLIKKHLWDFKSPVISRASSGAFERLSLVVFENTDEMLRPLKIAGYFILGCLANASHSMYQVDLTRPVVIAIGGEKRGLSASVRNHCDRFIKIPMLSNIGSLSLSHAASIVLAEAMRQRLMVRNAPGPEETDFPANDRDP